LIISIGGWLFIKTFFQPIKGELKSFPNGEKRLAGKKARDKVGPN